MNILLTGVECNNKGAELMLCAMVEHLRSRFPEAKLVCGFSGKKYENRVGRGLYQLETNNQKLVRFIDWFLPGKLDRWGLILPRDIDVVLDASGFCFSDNWPDHYVVAIAANLLRFYASGAKLVLLPQAFGPFQRASIRNTCKELFDKASLIFPRDQESFGYVRELLGSDKKLHLAPDFTNIVQGFVPQSFDVKYHGAVGILPNEKMIAKNEKTLQEAYITFLARCIQKLAARGVPHFLLCHQKEDMKVVDLLKAELDDIPYISSETNPLYIKGILGSCRFIIGSRFHGLVNGLSQGVPCICTSWSHKYEALFEDYHCSEYLISDFTSMEKANQLIDRLLDDKGYSEARANIESRSASIKKETVEMWNIVDSFLHGLP